MSLVPTWPIAVGTLVIGLLAGAYADHTVMSARIDKLNAAHSEELRQREVQRAADELKARNNERQMTEAVGLAEQEKTDEIAKVRTTAAADIARLQNRPDRKPIAAGGVPQAAAACAGSTGAELSRPDAEFSLGLATRADEQRAALSACYKAYDAIGQ
jgi:hypothetical protein